MVTKQYKEIDKRIIKLLKKRSRGLTRSQISEKLEIPRTTVYDHIRKMPKGLVKIKRAANCDEFGRGSPRKVYKIR